MDLRRDHSDRATERDPFEADLHWKGGAVAGFVATLAMGIAMMLVTPETLSETIAGLYGVPGSLVIGWLVHLFHGTIFGIGFAVLLDDPSLINVTGWLWKSVLVGILYGLLLAIVGTGVILPMWVSVVGFYEAPALPFVTVPLLAYHVIYGAVLGGLLPYIEVT